MVAATKARGLRCPPVLQKHITVPNTTIVIPCLKLECLIERYMHQGVGVLWILDYADNLSELPVPQNAKYREIYRV
jgi:hypothetical protein